MRRVAVFLLLTIFACRVDSWAQVDTTMRVGDIEKVKVSGKRTHYKKRDNVAVELVRRLIASRDKNNPYLKFAQSNYQRYERVMIAIDNFKAIDSTKKLSFLNEHLVTSEATGKTILPIMVKERVLQTTRRGPSHNHKKESELYNRSRGLDERFSQESIMAYLNTALPEIDIYADIIELVQRHFVGPLSSSAPSFYKYYLNPDTLTIDGERYVKLDFFPYAKEGAGLRGWLEVRADSTNFIRAIDVTIPNSADVNWLKNVRITQRYSEDSSGMRIIDYDDISFDFGVVKSLDAFAVKRENHYSMYQFSDNLQEPLSVVKSERSIVDTAKYANRYAAQNTQLDELAPAMRQSGFYRFTETVLLLLVDGYLPTGEKSYFDIGPVATFLTGNPLEGTRLGFGGVTTPNLSPYFALEARVGYGTRDQAWKYYLGAEWSFVKKDKHFKEFPVHSLRASVSYDTHRFGESFMEKEAENIFSWAKRIPDSSLTYVQRYELNYMREFKNHFSFNIAARHYLEKQSSVMSFYHDRTTLPQYRMSELELGLRYAPGEVIYQSKFRRRNLQKYSVTMNLNYTLGLPGVLGSNFRRNLTEFTVRSRIGIQPLGYLDLDAKLGAEWSRVPYMLLPHPSTDPSYMTASNSSFSFMSPLEFMYDRYVYWGITYHMDGFLLNKIPLIKHLKLREVFTFKGVWGYLSRQNNPNHNAGLPPLPKGASPIGHEPYMEIGVGIDNILSFFRVDYVWRITYLDSAPSSTSGLMFNFSLKF